jgi:hypothetical protein
VLLKKFFNVGFQDIAVAERAAFGLDDVRRYPLFAPEFIDFLRRAIPEHRHREMVFSIAVVARKPEVPAVPAL